jgi:hypothetical protein
MQIEKIKNYNQKMLALFSTIIVVMAAIGLVSLIIFIISDVINVRPDTNTLLSDKKVDDLKHDSLRKQIISYSTPELIDTASLVYIIPVNVKTLDKAEKIDEQTLGLLNSSKEIGSGSSEYSSENYYYGAFNNLILYDLLNNQTRVVCPDRIIGTDLQYKYFKDDIILAFSGSGVDTDKDNQITLTDFKDMYMYSLKDKQLKKISQPNSTVESYKYIPGNKAVLITFGLDRDKDNKFDVDTEPSFIMKYDFVSGELSGIINKTAQDRLQDIIDKNIAQ